MAARDAGTTMIAGDGSEGTGLVRFGARDYDATVGRWTGRDPVGFVDGTNVYLYVQNLPTRWVDPEGWWTIGIRAEMVFGGSAVGFAWVLDDDGRLALQLTTAVGVFPGVGFTVDGTVTNADSVCDLEGVGYVAGLSGTTPWGVFEGNMLIGDSYTGGEIGYGFVLGLPATPQIGFTVTATLLGPNN